MCLCVLFVKVDVVVVVVVVVLEINGVLVYSRLKAQRQNATFYERVEPCGAESHVAIDISSGQ